MNTPLAANRISSSLFLLLLAAPVAAQDALPSRSVPPDPRVPIHTQPDDPTGGRYGTWAAGRGFKISFETRGIAMFPRLGAHSQGHAWRWRTESVRAGSQLLVQRESTVTHWSSPDRYEYRFGATVTEAYDLRIDGVEQTFTIHQKPEGRGDLVVRGHIDSPWQPHSEADGHRGLAFGDGETVAIDYGRAWVIDAADRRVAIHTAYDGEYITLTVPGEIVATASYPLVIDPLIGPRAIRGLGTGAATSIDIARDDATDTIWMTVTAAASGRDDDLFVYRMDDELRNSVLVYSDITTSWSTEAASIATVGGARKAIATFHRVFSSTQHAVRWHVHDLSDVRLQTAYGVMPGASGSHDWRADVGGSRAFASGNHALIAFQRDASGTRFANTSRSMAMFAFVDVSRGTQGVVLPVRRLRTISYDQESPSVTPLAEGGSNVGWPVTWQAYGRLRGKTLAWDAVVRRVTPANGGSVSAQVVYARGSRSAVTQRLTPAIAGQSGRYALVYAESPVTLVSGKTPFPQGHALVAERLDWPATGRALFAHPPVRRHESSNRRFRCGGIGFDSDSRSHWAAVYVDTIDNQPRIDKLGYRGRVIVAQNVSLTTSVDPVVGGVAFDDDHDRFPVGFASLNTLTRGWNAYGALLTYRSANPPVAYGTGCTTATARWVGTHYRGDEFSAARLAGARANQPAFLLLSSRPATVGLRLIGMPRCFLNVDLATPLNLTVPMMTNSSGLAQVPLPLPEEFTGLNVFTQWYFVDPGANSLGVSATRGLHVTVVD